MNQRAVCCGSYCGTLFKFCLCVPEYGHRIEPISFWPTDGIHKMCSWEFFLHGHAGLPAGDSSGLYRALAEIALVHHDIVIASDNLQMARHELPALAPDFDAGKGLPVTTAFPRQ